MRVYDLMSRDVVSVHPETPLKEVARLLVKHAISGLPVVDERNVVLGVVSESDFMIKERGREHVSRSPLRWLLGEGQRDLHRVEATTAGQAMTSPVIVIEGRTASVREAAMLMAQHRVKRLPVTESRVLVGIITRADLLRIYVQTDDAIEAAVRDVLRETDAVALDQVREGIVTLIPRDTDRSTVNVARRVVEAVDGVMGVELAKQRPAGEQ
ncbi:MAG TPA: CBS domain-containing protein [Gemmatimonadales bacterium]|nr:CBS domain-containing protein [Gemmatimonadales bacterium]